MIKIQWIWHTWLFTVEFVPKMAFTAHTFSGEHVFSFRYWCALKEESSDVLLASYQKMPSVSCQGIVYITESVPYLIVERHNTSLLLEDWTTCVGIGQNVFLICCWNTLYSAVCCFENSLHLYALFRFVHVNFYTV